MESKLFMVYSDSNQTAVLFDSLPCLLFIPYRQYAIKKVQLDDQKKTRTMEALLKEVKSVSSQL